MLCVPWVTQAQVLSEYSLSVDTTTFTSIVSTGTAISLSTTDDGHGECNLPFVFPFGESMLGANTTLSCSANGFINLGGSASGTYAYYTSASQRIINALINQDAHSGRYTGSGVYYQLDTVDGVQCFTIEFHLLGRFSDPYGVYSHQVKLYENGNIQFVYDSVDLDGATATTLRTFLWDGPMDDLAFVTGPWANPTLGTNAATRPTSPTPVHGLRYTFTRPVILCPRVTNLTVSSATVTTADLTWQDTSASLWMLYYYPSDSIGQIDSVLVIDTPSYSLSSLYPNTEYTVQVVALCSDTTSSNPRSLVFRTLCLALTANDLPYTEDFESYGSGSASPISPCWYKHSTSSTAYPYPTSSNAISGSRSLYFYAYLGSSGTRYHSYAVLPYLDSTVSVNTLALLLDVKSYSTASQYYPSRLVVGVMTDPTDITTFTTVQEIDMYGLPANTEQQVVVDFSNYSGNGRYICLYDSIPILRGSANYGYSYIYADNIVLTELPNCATPTQLDTANVTRHEVDLTWSGSYDAQEYYVTYGPEDGTDTTITVSDTMVQLTDLLSGTTYHWSVRGYCGVDTSFSTQGPFFTTLCGEVTLPQLPYSYGFEDAASTGAGGAINPCWEKVGLNQTTAYPYPSSTAHTGTRSLYFYAYSGSNRKSWVCSPEMSVSMDSLLVTFWNRSSSTSYSGIIKVGTMSDPTDLGTFHLVASCRPNGTTWTYQEVPMATTDTGRYIAFLCETDGDPVSTSYNYAYLDDITIDLMPNCYHIVNLEVGGTTPVGAVLNWEPTPSDAEANYMVEYRADSSNTWIVAASDVTESSYSLSGLDAGTMYHARVSALCSMGDTSTFQSVQFTTGQFDCMEVDTTTMVVDTIGTGSSTTSGVPVNSSWGNTICQSIYLASELIAGGFDSTGATITDISYTWQNNASYAKEFTIYMNNSSQSTYSSYSASYWVVTGAAAQVYHGDHPIGTNGTVTYHLDTPFQWDGVSNLVITTTMNQPTGVSQSISSFYGYSTSCGATRTVYRYRDSSPFDGSNVTNLTSSGNTSQYRPNIILTSSACTRYATCAAPAVAADYVGPDTVVLSWAAGANETDWNIYYRVGESGDFTYVDNVSDMTYTFDGLQPATTYTFRVQTVCDPDTFNADLEVMTACAPVNVINEDFESYTTGSGGSINPCWHKHVQGTSTQYPYVNTIGSSKALYFYGYNSNNSTRYLCWATTPEMLDSLSTYELEFDMRRTSTGSQYWSRLIIGAMTDPDNIATFDTIAVVDAAVASVWEPKYVSLENYHDTSAHYIAILSPSPDLAPGYSYAYNYAYMDNLYVGRRSSCPRPTRFHARDITDVSAELAWDGSDEHLSATVKWGTVNNINAATDSLEVFSNSVVLNALTPTTTYSAWITAQCADEGSRTYSCSFTTSAACNPIDNITISEVTTNMAAITWDDNDLTPAIGYTFRWKADSATTWNVVNLTQPFYFLTGLTEGTSYSVSVSAICNTDSATAVTQSFATLTNGTLGGSSEQLVLPTYPNYNYSISEQLWTASELNIYGDTVNGIYFNSSAINPDRVMKIWITDTTLSDLSTSNYVSSADMTLVYDSTHSITTGWNYFQFTTPYVRNSNNNLVVLVMDSTGEYEDFEGWYGGVGAGTSLFAYNDDDPYSSTNLSSLNTATSRAQMMLDARLVAPTCMAPHVVAADVTGSSVTLAWMAGQDETSWTVDYRQSGDTGWTSYTVSTTDTFAVVGGLNPSTQYQFRVGALCAADTQYAHLLANTACGTYDVPYIEDFNNYANNTYRFNACWYYGNASTTNEPYTINITGQGMMMLMPVDSYVILPAVNGSISSLQLRCDYVVADTNIYALVGICSHPHDIYSMTVIDTLWASANGVPEQVIVPFDSYTDTAGYICIYSSYNQSYYDNIRIEPIPACPTVDSLMATNISTTSADFAWVGSANATSYLVQYGLVGSDSTTTVSTTNNYITLLGLHHSTSYQVTVSTVCAGMNDTSLATNPYVFMTNCQPVDSLPYFEDFDHSNAPALTNTGILPNCWTYQTLASGTYATGNYLPQIYNSSTYASSGNYSLHLYGNALTILPEMPTTVDQLMISFHHYNTSINYYDMVIGVCDSNTPGCEASFVPIDTIQSTAASEWVTSYRLASYTGTGRFIAFRNYYRTSTTIYYSTHYIDDITVDYLPSCLPPLDVHSTANTSTSIQLTWLDMVPASEWEIAYGTSPMTDPSTGTVVNTTTKPYTLTGLGDSLYYFYVRTVCGSGDTSIWSDAFSARPGTWVMRNGYTDTLYMCQGHIYDDGGPNGNYSNSANATIVLMPSDTIHRVRIGGSWISEGCCDRLGIYDGIGTSGTQFYYGYAGTSGITVGPFESTTGPITLTFSSDGSVNYAGFDLTVECVADYCQVRNIRTDTSVAPSSSALALTWDGTSPEYTVVYGPAGFDRNDSSATTLTVYTNHVVLPGLTSMARYDVYVRGICDAYGTGGSDTGSYSMATLQVPMCDNVIEAFSYDSTMSATTSSYVPMGTSFYNYGFIQTIVDSARLADLTGDIAAWAFKSVNGTQGNYYNHIDVYFANVSENNLNTEFIHPDSNHVFVQVLHDADLCYTDGGWHMTGLDTAFTWDGHSNLLVTVNRRHGSYSSGASFDVHNGRSGQSRYVYNDGTAYNLATVSGGTATSAVGDMMFYACGQSCADPLITGVTYDYQSATVFWTGSGTSYQVAIKESVALDWPDSAISVTGNSYTFTGLSAATGYSFRVRQDCTADSLGYSNWVESGFITDSLPCLSPDSLVVSDLTNAQGTFSWHVNGFETQWDLHVWNTGGLDTVYRLTTNPATVGGFTAGVTYNAAIRPICGTAELEGNYSDTISFTAQICPDVTGLTSSNVTESSVTLNWTADPMAESWQIEYGFAGFAQGTGTSVTTNVNNYVVTGLEDESSYDFYVRAICGTDWNSEGWAHVSATTPAASDPTYTVTVTVNDAAMGSATGGGTYRAGQSCTVTATPNSDYHFVSWSNGVTDNPYTFTVVANITLTATFAADSTEGIEEVAGNALCTIYPNPTSDVTTISVSGANGKVRIAVVDINGRTVATETLECSSDCEKTMDVANLAQGAYFVKITGENVNMVKKLVVR